MQRLIRPMIPLFLLALVATGCASWTKADRVLVCQESINVLAKPECVRLVEVGQEYADLCNSVLDAAVVACDAGINGDPALICPTIVEQAPRCQLIPDGSGQRDLNVATCERVIRAAGLACTIALADREPDPVPAPE